MNKTLESTYDKNYEWDHFADTDTADVPIERVMREEIIDYLKIEKAPGPTEVYTYIILASGDVVIRVLMELYQRIPHSKRMAEYWATIVAFHTLEETEIS